MRCTWWPVIKGILRRLKKDRRGRRRRLKGARGRGTLENEKPPIFGMIQRGGAVVVRMLENVQQTTIRPLIERFIAPGSRVYTDEYDIDHRLPEWGFDHRTVCHSRGEYARDEDGNGFHEVHVNTAEGFCSLFDNYPDIILGRSFLETRITSFRKFEERANFFNILLQFF